MGAIAAVVGTVVSAGGAIAQGNAAAEASRQQAQARNYQAAVANNNAIAAEQNARRAEQVAQTNAQAKSMEARARLGKVKAAQASSGIDVNTGSALDVQEGTRELGKLDTDTVFSNDLVKAYGYKSDAQNYRSQADLLRYGAQGLEARAGSEETAGYLKAGGTLLSSASSLPFGKWLGGTGTNYDLGSDTVRTAGDRDLAGYS